MQRPWQLRGELDPARVDLFQRELSIPRVGAELLLRRGIAELDAARAWLSGETEGEHDPFLLPQLREAAGRIWSAIDAGEKIVVHGDYDADGISGTALLCAGLRGAGASAEPFVPDRQRDGYGVATRLIEHAVEKKVGVLITVDTGSSAHEALAAARAGGIDVIVCDHHLYDEAPPVAYFLNPQRPDSEYPHRELCGCAVAYKLLCGVAALRPGTIDPAEQWDLLALGVIADQMELRGENRGFVRRGLDRLANAPRPGMLAMLETAKLLGIAPSSDDIAFQLAPRINAAGRIDSPRNALQLLLTEDPAEARRLAYHLDQVNRRRREMDRRVTEEAQRDAEQFVRDGHPAALVLASENWHMGVVGISAARVADHHDLPTVILAIDGDEARGSARSAGGVDLKATLDQCAEHMVRYGGHAEAAGMTLRRGRIEAFRAAFERAAAGQPRSSAPAGRLLDARIELDEFGLELVEFLERFGPFGAGHAAPVFASFGVSRLGDPRIVGERHLKLHVTAAQVERSFIGFSMADRRTELAPWPRLDLAYRIRYRAGSAYDPWELQLVDLRAAADPSQERSARA